MQNAFDKIFRGLPVLVTGHTGFKGSWLSIWLQELGAQVIGYSLPPPTTPSNFEVSHLDHQVIHVEADVRDLERLSRTIEQYQPRVVFHLAGQTIVLDSYQHPRVTFDTNAGGTVSVLEAIRTTTSVKAAVCITTDKVYENREWVWGYRENDRLGGYDPYSASKAMAELAIASYRQSFFPADRYAEHGVAIASTRAGNVIGGGDFAAYRLLPDCMRALMAGQPIVVRNPYSVRPWQHVLEPLSGYLWLAGKLLQEGPAFAEAWNFGPLERQSVTTETLVKKVIDLWEEGSYQIENATGPAPKESAELRLNWDKAANCLQWRPLFTWQGALTATVDWFQHYYQRQSAGEPVDMYQACVEQIRAYTERARAVGLVWATGVSL